MKNIQQIQSGKYHEGFERIDTTKEQSSFFDLPNQFKCTHPEHEPPKHLHIPQDKGYKHVCTACGKTAILIPPQVTL